MACAKDRREAKLEFGAMTLRFRYSGMFVADVPATVAFYEKAFGFHLRYLHPTRGYAELETGETLVAFVSDEFTEAAGLLGGVPYAKNRPEADPCGFQLALVTDDMDRDWAQAIEAGATLVKAPQAKPWGQTTGYLRDCNGVIVELCTQSPRERRANAS
jgi:lactoylglutathione lyase